jgi:predicted metal-dependent phosphoesterase TrpH
MRFNLADYETVEERLRRAHAQYEDLRVVTEWENNNRYELDADRPPAKTWVVKAYIFLTAGDQANNLPKATGYAFEIDGTGGANNGSALENAETSAIGRALANMNLSGNKRASREEMQKVERIAATDWLAEAEKLMNVADLRNLYTRAKAQGAPNEVLEKLKDYANALNTSSEDQGTRGSAKGSAAGK